MSNTEKRYRCQIQFDLFTETDKEAVQELLDIISEMKTTSNHQIVYLAESPFGSFNIREIDHQKIESVILDEEEKRKNKIIDSLKF